MRYDRLRPYGFLIVIAFIYFGLLNIIIAPIQIFIDILLG